MLARCFVVLGCGMGVSYPVRCSTRARSIWLLPLVALRDAMLVFELRCAATLTLLSLLEGCNDAARPELMVQTINFGAIQNILDVLWRKVKVRGPARV